MNSMAGVVLPKFCLALWCCCILLACSEVVYGQNIDAQLASGAGTRRLLGQYKKADEVALWASKVGPFANPRCVTLCCFANKILL